MFRVMLTLGIAALLAAPATAQQVQPAKSIPNVALTAKAAHCQPTAGIVTYRGGEVSARKLGEMPPASQIYTVYNQVDGCPTPVVVREGIGGNPAQQQPVLRVPPKASGAR